MKETKAKQSARARAAENKSTQKRSENTGMPKTEAAAGNGAGPGADRALFEYIEKFRWGQVSFCKCEDRGRCLHSNSLTQLAWEMLCNFLKYEPHAYKRYEMPQELVEFRKKFREAESRYEKLRETAIALLPKNKRPIKGLLDRAQGDHRQLERAFFIAVGYVRGIADHEDLTTRKLRAAEKLLTHVRLRKDRPFYDRAYLAPSFEISHEQMESLLKADNHVAPGNLAEDMNWDMEEALRLEADRLAREFKRTKDPKFAEEEIRVLGEIRRFREESEKVWGNPWDDD